ncbi:MAG: hypothetical protein ACRC16_17010, partial [Aeromonas salmonicida]
MGDSDIHRNILSTGEPWEEDVRWATTRPIDRLFPAMWDARLLQDPANKVVGAEVPVVEGRARAHHRVVAEGVHRPSAGRAATARIVDRDDRYAQVPFQEKDIVSWWHAGGRKRRRGSEHPLTAGRPKAQGFKTNNITACRGVQEALVADSYKLVTPPALGRLQAHGQG